MRLDFWPFRRVRARDSAANDTVPDTRTTGPEDQYEAAKTILALAIERYQYEHGRTKDIESKAGPALGLSSAILVLAAGTLKERPPCLVGWNIWVYHLFIVLGIGAIFAALYFLIQTLRPAVFQYFDLDRWVRYEEMRRSPEEQRALLEDIAGSYREYTALNLNLNDRKAQYFAISTYLLPLGILLIGIGLLWASCDLPRLW